MTNNYDYTVVSQSDFAEKIGITNERLVELCESSQGFSYHAHPSATNGEYLFFAGMVETHRKILACIDGDDHKMEFDHYYDSDRKLPVMVCRNCSRKTYPIEPYYLPSHFDATDKQKKYLLDLEYSGDVEKLTRKKASELISTLREYVGKNSYHYCGAPASGFGFFDEPACGQCGGSD